MPSSYCSNNTNKLSPQEQTTFHLNQSEGSNNTNKLSPQEHIFIVLPTTTSSNNTNKLSPQEPAELIILSVQGSNNTNKLSPQELSFSTQFQNSVQIIQINLVLKNYRPYYSIIVLYLQYILSISIIKY